jgi:hypothetical protein
MAVKTSASPTVPMAARTTQSAVEHQEQIRRRAFEIFEQRGREDGHDLEDWLQAESELAQHRIKLVAA